MNSHKTSGAANQQERLDAYIAGYVDGEGSFHVAVQRNPSTSAGWQLVPEFRVRQDRERRQVLDLIRKRLGCGRIVENHRGTADTTLVLVVRRRKDLLERILPFFEANPLLSAKQQELSAFVDRSSDGGGRAPERGGVPKSPPHGCLDERGRSVPAVASVEASGILRDHTPDTVTFRGSPSGRETR